MVDLQETPATPAADHGGDERIGYFSAGGILIALGWGFGVVANALLHWMARTGPFEIWGVHFSGSFGPYAWAVFGFGLVTGAMGVVLVGVARSSPKGRFVLPGADY